MTQLATVLVALRDGALLGVQYNPMVAAATVALAAGIMGVPRKGRRIHPERAALVLGVGWLVGDGLRILARARDLFDSAAVMSSAGLPMWPTWTTIAAWALVSLALGYVAPAFVGGAVGRRVTHGTGWIAAAGVAVAFTLAVSAGIGALG